MGDEVNPPTKPRRLRLVLALAAALLAGIGLGVVADRVYLWNAQRPPDPRLIGEWVAPNYPTDNEGTIVRFHEDGTYDYTVRSNDDGKVWHTTYQYRWINRDTIEMYERDIGWTTRKLVFEGDELKVLHNGTVWRLKQKNG